jgi:hypothetical protein
VNNTVKAASLNFFIGIKTSNSTIGNSFMAEAAAKKQALVRYFFLLKK